MPNQENTKPAPANFTPTLGAYISPKPLRYWVQPILPLTFDDSLSYMEVLAKMGAKLNELIEAINDADGNTSGCLVPEFDENDIGKKLGVIDASQNTSAVRGAIHFEPDLAWVAPCAQMFKINTTYNGSSLTGAWIETSYNQIKDMINGGTFPWFISTKPDGEPMIWYVTELFYDNVEDRYVVKAARNNFTTIDRFSASDADDTLAIELVA